MKKTDPAKLTYSCIYQKNRNGMGGIAIEKKTKTKIYIADNVEKFALDNDEVLVEVINPQHNPLQGAIIRIEKHQTKYLTGFIQPHKPKHILKVNNSKFGHYLVLINSPIKKVDREQIVKTIIKSYPNENQPFFEVDLIKNTASSNDDLIFTQELINELEIPLSFSKASLLQASKLPKQVLSSEITNYTDLRDIPFVTIDGEDAKDFDDAVFCENIQGKYKLYVAIADVSHYVTDNSPLDKEAYLRGTSIYLPKQVIPMLPESISNGLCSLNPHVDRLTVCACMEINAEGNITNYQVFNAVIHSHARLTYNQVQQWVNDLSQVPVNLISNISNLYLVYQALLSSRKKRGAIDFDTVEPLFKFDDMGNIENLVPRTRVEAHKLIEECMLAANVTVADFLIKHEQATLFRVHEKPSLEKFTALKDHLHALAIKFDIKYEQLTPKHYSKLLQEIHGHPEFEAIQNSVLRSMQLAIYSSNNLGHFGLSYKQYLHFTSPIRRYPDLLVHRVVKSILEKEQYKFNQPLMVMGEHTSFTERRAEDMERKISMFYKCQFANKHIGSEFEGIVTSVVDFGLFVYIPELLIDGLLHVTELGSDYFIFNDKALALVGKSSGISYAHGQKIRIAIAGVNMAKLFIDLKIVL